MPCNNNRSLTGGLTEINSEKLRGIPTRRPRFVKLKAALLQHLILSSGPSQVRGRLCSLATPSLITCRIIIQTRDSSDCVCPRLTISWREGRGWGQPRIGQHANLSLSPASKVLHYAQELYEGMKAYRGVDDKLRLFRPDLNMKRMNQTANR